MNELLCSSQNSSSRQSFLLCTSSSSTRGSCAWYLRLFCRVLRDATRLNLECIPCKRWLIACGCTCKFVLEFWVLIIRCLRSSIHLCCAGCSNVSDHCWALDGGESLPFLTVIVIPPLSMILAGRPVLLAPLTGTSSCAYLDKTSPLVIDLACVGKE